MSAQIQVIERNGKPEYAVVPYHSYLRLMEEAEMLADIRDYDATTQALARGEEELIPSRVTYSLLDGENPVKVWREYRRLTPQQLADAVGITLTQLTQIETGQRKGTTAVLTRLAKALRIALDDLRSGSSTRVVT
jgi:DNA-binding XRE family transcriptional regulator